MQTAQLVLTIVEYWAWIGLVVASLFLTVGLGRVDANARGAYVFRPLLLPGVVLIWPMVLWRWAVLEAGFDRPNARHDPPRRGHARIWMLLALLVPAILIAGLLVRQDRTAPWPAPVYLGEVDR